jgi:hypothetical protein
MRSLTRSQEKTQVMDRTGKRSPNQLAIEEKSSLAKKLLSKQLSGLVSAKTDTDTTDTNPQEHSLPAATVAKVSTESF